MNQLLLEAFQLYRFEFEYNERIILYSTVVFHHYLVGMDSD